MKQCWVEDSGSRPSFAELEARLDVILSKAQSENYIDLNVDEMLPYYSAMEQIDEVDDPQMKNNGYPDTSNITAQGFIADIVCSPSSNFDNGSITDADVQNFNNNYNYLLLPFPPTTLYTLALCAYIIILLYHLTQRTGISTISTGFAINCFP